MVNTTANTVSNPSAVNTAAKDILARILAGENLTIEHNPKAHTAMFDTKNRVLTLPVWENMSEAMYDMLIGHEVGHALFTPWTERDEAANGIAAAADIGGAGNAHIAMDYLNVVEDARIERMVQDKFPGLRRDFFNAYGEMVNSDFFGLKGTDINSLPLLDRLNIHFKLGTQSPQTIIFTPDEQKFVDRIAAAQSFDDVTVIAQDLYSFCGNKRNDKKREEYMEQVRVKGNPGDGEGEGAEMNGADDADGSEMDDNNGTTPGDKQSDDDNQKDSETAGNEAGKMSQTPARSRTQQAIDAALNKKRDQNTRRVAYGVLDTPNLTNIIWDYKMVAADMAAHDAKCVKSSFYTNDMRELNAEFAAFMAEATPIVNNMVKQFEMRKAADKAKRTSVSRSGVIDTVRMMNYKLTDDIFRRNAVVADGKNHGLVMFIDWSSSMSGVILNTVKQLMLLTMFCRKVNIPFEVYAFTSVPQNKKIAAADSYGGPIFNSSDFWSSNAKGNQTSAGFHAFNLLNFISSRMKGNEYKTGLETLFRIGTGASRYSGNLIPASYNLGSTPLDECIAAAMDIVPKFRDANKLQIVNAVFLTDGDSSGNNLPRTSHYYGSKGFIVDPVTKKTYEAANDNNNTATLLHMFRDRAKCNAIGFFLMGNKTLCTAQPWYDSKNVRDEKAFGIACSSYNTNGFAVSLPNYNGYTEQYLIRSSTMEVTNANEALNKIDNGAATVAQVTRALAKDASAKNQSKLLLNRFIDLIAKA